MAIRIGDVFEIQLTSQKFVYFQYIGLDITQLNSEVVRVFKTQYSVGFPDKDLSQIVTDEVDFYVHTVIKWGLKGGFWKKIGNASLEKELKLPMFRATDDIGNPAVKVSKKWFIWKMGGDFISVGLLNDYAHIDLGLVEPAKNILYRIIHGSYEYPSTR